MVWCYVKMSAPKKLTLRVQSAEGTTRVEVLGSEPSAALYERVQSALRLASAQFVLSRDRARREPLPRGRQPLTELGLQHGDMLFLCPAPGAALPRPASPTPAARPFGDQSHKQSEAGPSSAPALPPAPSATAPSPADAPVEDDVDLFLYKQSGNIERQRDDKLCRHNSKGSCVHCAPREPWDEEHLKAHNIKHMSFHAFLRKSTQGKFVTLEELSLDIKPGCKEHPPWPRGICSKCQPGAVTLLRQPYRHVDNVLVESGALVDRFLAYWRLTAHQRIGWLYGHYEPHPDVPLGIRARVTAIYEPPQESSRDHVTLQTDRDEAALGALAARLGLRRVGWIFTDLLPDGDGQVKCVRGVDTHFLSAQECIMAGQLQAQHRSACRYSTSGYFGSKFVTVCVTGDAAGRVTLEGYQVSGQGQALAASGALLPTRDAPDLAYVRRGDKLPVPDVYYKERDQYGNEVPVAARRLPVAYLLVDVPVGTAAGGAGAGGTAAGGAGAGGAACSFPPAHRPLPQHLQTPAALQQHLDDTPDFLQAMSDLHVLLYLATNETAPLSLEALAPLLTAVKHRDSAAATAWRASPAAAPLHALLAAAAAAHAAPPAAAAGGAEVWTCPHCTYHNEARRDACDMCALPR